MDTQTVCAALPHVTPAHVHGAAFCCFAKPQLRPLKLKSFGLSLLTNARSSGLQLYAEGTLTDLENVYVIVDYVVCIKLSIWLFNRFEPCTNKGK